MLLSSLDWFTLALISSILISFTGVFQKVAIKDQNVDPAAFSIYSQLLVGLFAAAFAFKDFGKITFTVNMILGTVLMSFCYASATLLYYYALKKTELSQVKIISATRSLWVMLGGFMFLGEVITLNKTIGILFIVLGISVVYWHRNGIKGLGIPHLLMVIYAVITAAAGILDKYLLNFFTNPNTYIIASFIVPSFLTALFMPGSAVKIAPVLKSVKLSFSILAAALTLNLATLCLFTALQNGGEISKAGAIWQASTIFSVLLGITLLKERENALRKIIGVIIVVAGILFIR